VTRTDRNAAVAPARLDGVREGDGHGGKGDVRQAVAEGVQERGQRYVFQKLLVRLLEGHYLDSPESCHDEKADHQVHAGDKPGKRGGAEPSPAHFLSVTPSARARTTGTGRGCRFACSGC